jgi:hypothetical protein
MDDLCMRAGALHCGDRPGVPTITEVRGTTRLTFSTPDEPGPDAEVPAAGGRVAV